MSAVGSSRFLRLSAIPTSIAAVLLFGFGLTPAVLLPTSEPLLEWVRDPAWLPLNLLALVMSLLLPLSLVAAYAAQVGSLGRIGASSFLMAFLGSLLYMGLQFDETFVWPILATEAPDLLQVQGPLLTDAAFATAYLVMGLLFMVGWLGFGVVTSRAGVFPRGCGVLLAIGMPVFGAGNVVPVPVRGAGAVLAAIGLALISRVLWHGHRPTGPGAPD